MRKKMKVILEAFFHFRLLGLVEKVNEHGFSINANEHTNDTQNEWIFKRPLANRFKFCRSVGFGFFCGCFIKIKKTAKQMKK